MTLEWGDACTLWLINLLLRAWCGDLAHEATLSPLWSTYTWAPQLLKCKKCTIESSKEPNKSRDHDKTRIHPFRQRRFRQIRPVPAGCLRETAGDLGQTDWPTMLCFLSSCSFTPHLVNESAVTFRVANDCFVEIVRVREDRQSDESSVGLAAIVVTCEGSQYPSFALLVWRRRVMGVQHLLSYFCWPNIHVNFLCVG
jgi:hypothetical protein